MSVKLVPIIAKTKDCMSWDGVQVLQSVIEEIKAGNFPNKLMVIGLDDSDGRFKVWWRKAGIVNSQGIALMEYAKHDLISYLTGQMIPEDEEDE